MDSTPDTARGLHWNIEWRTALFTALFLPVLLGLGSWQLDRAEEKAAITDRWEARKREAPVALSGLAGNAEELAYRRVLLQGEYLLGRDFLLDNRIVNGRYGVEVITPLRLANDGTVVLVNRGWIEADSSRRTLPVIAVEPGPVSLQGSVYVSPGAAYTLGEIATGDAWPRLVQAVDIEALSKLLGEPVFPYTVRLEPAAEVAYWREWPAINTSPQKHRAYAVQWFSMGVVLALLFVWRSTNLAEIFHRRRSRNQ